MYILIYLLPLTQRQENTRRHSLVIDIDTLTTCRKSVNIGLSEKEALWKKDSVIIKTAMSPNLKTSRTL